MAVFAERAVDELGRTMGTAGNAVTEAAVNSTAVLKGRARSNWLAGIGSRPQGEVPEPAWDKSGQKAIADAAEVLAKFKLQQGDIFVTNNTPYIEQLNNGRSSQSQNMLAIALIAGQQAAKKRKINLGD